ncbi:MAG TPA: hypothetical protein GX505_01755 [Clostridiales bacterium]|nr:hypothetical protein [Clostridiales bacterium]
MRRLILYCIVLSICLIGTSCAGNVEEPISVISSPEPYDPIVDYESDNNLPSPDIESEQPQDMENQSDQETRNKEYTVVIGCADLNHDGKKEKIVADLTNLEEFQEAWLKIYDADNNLIWEEAAGLPHAGWNSIYLYHSDGKDYLIRYNPVMYQGFANYQYTIFRLNARGEEIEEASNAVDFDINPNSTMFDSDSIAAFVEELNALLEESTLLLSTENSVLSYSTEDQPIVRTEQLDWLYTADLGYDEDDSIKDKLEKYHKYHSGR